MSRTVKSKTDQKSEFLMELAERYAYWKAKKNNEYAKAYEHMMCAFTTPPKEVKKDS